MWWQQKPSTPYATPTGVILSNGAQDVEKGNIYSLPAGSPVTIPIPSRVAWEDSQHVVLQTTQGILNFLHVNPSSPVGAAIPSNKPFGSVSALGSSGNPNSYYDPSSGITYVESGNVIEFGSYDKVSRAATRDNYVNGIDTPYDFTGINNPSLITGKWNAGNTPQTLPSGGTSLDMGINPWLILIAVLIIIFVMVRR